MRVTPPPSCLSRYQPFILSYILYHGDTHIFDPFMFFFFFFFSFFSAPKSPLLSLFSLLCILQYLWSVFASLLSAINQFTSPVISFRLLTFCLLSQLYTRSLSNISLYSVLYSSFTRFLYRYIHLLLSLVFTVSKYRPIPFDLDS